jgi:hypothetical protein
MQDRYVGDVGDFGKFALLRTLATNRKIAICWYKTDGSFEKNADGKHTSYFHHRNVDPHVYDVLSCILEKKKRFIAELEAANLVDNAVYHSEIVPENFDERQRWHDELRSKVSNCNLLFLDPDNGLQGSKPSSKHVLLEEISVLRRPGRAIVLYCHQDRTKGGAPAFAVKIRASLKTIGIENSMAIRLRPGTSRCYFMIDFDDQLHNRAKMFVAKWPDGAELI